MKGVVIAGTGSGAGKTSITSGILSRLSKDHKVQAYKVGPDFIDPMYHTAATGRSARNLDAFMMSRDRIRNLVGHSSKGADLCIVEGVRGLYEGLTGTTDECSTAEMAKILGFPVVLVMNARSLTRSAAAMVNGFQSFDRGLKIAGVILNNVTGRVHETKLRDAMEKYTDVEVIGVVRRNMDLSMGERHLGLVTENANAENMRNAEELVSELDMDRMMDVLETTDVGFPEHSPYVQRECPMKVAVPVDDAYCFYYRENLECMEASGAEIVKFRPVDGEALPDADMCYLGGGYPELHLKEISENSDFTEGLRNMSEEGRIVFGECGGLMTMCRSVESDGMKWNMCGIFDAESKITRNRHGPSYVIAESRPGNPLFEGTVRGHEYHYSEVYPKSKDMGFRILRGTGIKDGMDGLMTRRSLGCYIHQHALSVDDWFGNFIDP